MEPRLGTYVTRARAIHSFFVKFHSETETLEDSNPAKAARQQAYAATLASQQAFADCWANRFPEQHEREAYKNPAPVKQTVEAILVAQGNILVSIQAALARLEERLGPGPIMD